MLGNTNVRQDQTWDSKKNVKRNKNKSFGAYKSKFLRGVDVKKQHLRENNLLNYNCKDYCNIFCPKDSTYALPKVKGTLLLIFWKCL